MHIEKNSVQETLIIPLYGRVMCTRMYPQLFQDTQAENLIRALDYDFSALEKKSRSIGYRFGALETAMRQYDMKMEMQAYLNSHPHASLVNLGCGLDTTCESIDNGKCRIYNLDMPDVIETRNALLPPNDRTVNIACDLNDHTWADQIESSDGVCFMAAGVFYYFTKTQIRDLFAMMKERFPGGRLVFDTAGKMAVSMMVKTFIKDAGISSIEECFYIEKPDKDLAWLNAEISWKGYMLGYNDLKHPSVSALLRMLAKTGDSVMKMRIIRIDF